MDGMGYILIPRSQGPLKEQSPGIVDYKSLRRRNSLYGKKTWKKYPFVFQGNDIPIYQWHPCMVYLPSFGLFQVYHLERRWRSPLPLVLVYHGPWKKSPPNLGVAPALSTFTMVTMSPQTHTCLEVFKVNNQVSSFFIVFHGFGGSWYLVGGFNPSQKKYARQIGDHFPK